MRGNVCTRSVWKHAQPCGDHRIPTRPRSALCSTINQCPHRRAFELSLAGTPTSSLGRLPSRRPSILTPYDKMPPELGQRQTEAPRTHAPQLSTRIQTGGSEYSGPTILTHPDLRRCCSFQVASRNLSRDLLLPCRSSTLYSRKLLWQEVGCTDGKGTRRTVVCHRKADHDMLATPQRTPPTALDPC